MDLLLAKMNFYKMNEEFAEYIEGFCDFTTFLTKLKLGDVCKSAKFQDIIDVYKQVTNNILM